MVNIIVVASTAAVVAAVVAAAVFSGGAVVRGKIVDDDDVFSVDVLVGRDCAAGVAWYCLSRIIFPVVVLFINTCS